MTLCFTRCTSSPFTSNTIINLDSLDVETALDVPLMTYPLKTNNNFLKNFCDMRDEKEVQDVRSYRRDKPNTTQSHSYRINSKATNVHKLHQTLMKKKNRIDMLDGIQFAGSRSNKFNYKQISHGSTKVSKNDICQGSEKYLFTIGDLKSFQGILDIPQYREELRRFFQDIKLDSSEDKNPVELLMFIESIEMFEDFKRGFDNCNSVLISHLKLARSVISNFVVPTSGFCAPISEELRVQLIVRLAKNIYKLKNYELCALITEFRNLFKRCKREILEFLEKTYLKSFKISQLTKNSEEHRIVDASSFEQFSDILESEDILVKNLFANFLKKHFAHENYLFIEKVHKYKGAAQKSEITLEELANQMHTIISLFINVGSELEVNISENVRSTIMNDSHNGLQISIFDEAVEEIKQLLEQNYFAKFQDSLKKEEN